MGENIAEKVKSTDGVYDLKDSLSVLEELIQRIMDVLLKQHWVTQLYPKSKVCRKFRFMVSHMAIGLKFV